MPNHPNRAWRATMQRSCAAWLAAWRWPVGGIAMLDTDGLRSIMRQAYMSGYEAGRESVRPPAKP